MFYFYKHHMRKMNLSDLISVIVPVYNMELYLERCLDSICGNTYEKLEIICVNDGSTDSSLKILQQYAERDDRIFIIDQLNGGISSARNAGLNIAKGEFIAFVDSDDWVHKNFFEFQLRAIKDNNADLAVCDYIRTDDELIFSIEEPQYCVQEISIKEKMCDNRTKNYVWNTLFRKEVIGSLRFNERSKIEDSLFNLQIIIANSNLRIVKVETILYAYFIREGSLVTQFTPEVIRNYTMTIARYCDDNCPVEICSILAADVVKRAMNTRYLYRILGNTVVEQEMNSLIKSKLKLLSEDRTKYTLLFYMPELYRWYRLWKDHTMLDYEKNLKLQRNKE